MEALRRAPGMVGNDALSDSSVFLSLYLLNSTVTRFLNLDMRRVLQGWKWRFPATGGRDPERAHIINDSAGEVFATVLERSVALANARGTRTLGLADLVRATVELSFEKGDSFFERPALVDKLASHYGDHMAKLSRLPGVQALLRTLLNSPDGAEDFQYILSIEKNRLVFRVVSILDDYVQRNGSGLLVPSRAILTHFRDNFGGFTQEEIQELEDLLNSPAATELDLQRFFELHTHFLRRWDYREVYSHITLARTEGDLVPDFILVDRDLQRAAVLELKLPKPKLIRRQRNRVRFSSAVMEARGQLLRYRDWFREKQNRLKLKRVVGMEIYEPYLIAVIGRSSEFNDALDRQRLLADTPDIEVVTYDDILTFAERRRIIITGM